MNFLQTTALIHFAHTVASMIRIRVKKWRLIGIKLTALRLCVLVASRLGSRMRQIAMLIRFFVLVILMTLD